MDQQPVYSTGFPEEHRLAICGGTAEGEQTGKRRRGIPPLSQRGKVSGDGFPGKGKLSGNHGCHGAGRYDKELSGRSGLFHQAGDIMHWGSAQKHIRHRRRRACRRLESDTGRYPEPDRVCIQRWGNAPGPGPGGGGAAGRRQDTGVFGVYRFPPEQGTLSCL